MTIGTGYAHVHAQAGTGVSCLPDRVVAAPGEKVALSVWTAMRDAAAPSRMHARWTVSGGGIATQTPMTTWLLEGVSIDQRQTAVVEVDVDGVLVGTCSVGVWVASADRPSWHEPVFAGNTSRAAFLRNGQVATDSPTVISMREPATSPETARTTAFINAFLDVRSGSLIRKLRRTSAAEWFIFR
jgi:hypothetical protein